jgi:hypothetical protein
LFKSKILNFFNSKFRSNLLFVQIRNMFKIWNLFKSENYSNSVKWNFLFKLFEKGKQWRLKDNRRTIQEIQEKGITQKQKPQTRKKNNLQSRCWASAQVATPASEAHSRTPTATTRICLVLRLSSLKKVGFTGVAYTPPWSARTSHHTPRHDVWVGPVSFLSFYLFLFSIVSFLFVDFLFFFFSFLKYEHY